MSLHAAPAAAEGSDAEDDEEKRTVVVHTPTPRPRAASDVAVDPRARGVPARTDSSQLLEMTPGLFIARTEGDAVAPRIFLRGFDAEHGQDIEMRVGDVPLNQMSHIHGQGYSDLGVVMPEVVRAIHVNEGVYDPRQGDFAVAGSATFDLGVGERGLHSHSTGGSFGTFRQALVWAPRSEADETFGAVAVRRTSGFGENRGGLSGVAVAQLAFTPRPRTRVLLHAAAHGTRSGIPGALRRDDIESGVVGFYDTYDDPSARIQSSYAARSQLAATLEHRARRGGTTRFTPWFSFTSFRLTQNLTGYVESAQLLPNVAGRADLVDQRNRDHGIGARFAHQTRSWRLSSWAALNLAAGVDTRLHWIDQTQRLLEAPGNHAWDERVGADVRAGDVGGWVDLGWDLTRFLHVHTGARVDLLQYAIEDRLGNLGEGEPAPGRRRSAFGVAAGPRTSVEVRPVDWLRIYGAYGEGYRSPQALVLARGEDAPFSKVRSVDGGLGFVDPNGRAEATVSGYATFLSDDLVFEAEENALESVGPTRRAGIAAHGEVHPWPFLLVAASVTWVDAVLRSPPAPTMEDPSPSRRVPYVPPLVVRVDASAHGPIATVRGHSLVARVGASARGLAPRPLPDGQLSDPVLLLDYSAGLGWRMIEVGVDVLNVANRRWAAMEQLYVSRWDPTAAPTEARHIFAGPPLTVMATLSLHFGSAK